LFFALLIIYRKQLFNVIPSMQEVKQNMRWTFMSMI